MSGLDEFMPPGEIVALAMSEDEVEQRIQRIKTAVAEVWGDLIALYQARAWVTLGLPSWEALCDERLGMRPRLSVDDRRPAVAQMTEAGMSTPAIAKALSIGVGTVHRDQSTFPNGKVEPRQVIGQDGRTRTYTPTPQQVEAANDFVADLQANDPDIRAANIRKRFSKWLWHLSQHHLLDPEECARVSPEEMDDLQRFRAKFNTWCDAYNSVAAPRPALRVVSGKESE